jgi:transposase-like protein
MFGDINQAVAVILGNIIVVLLDIEVEFFMRQNNELLPNGKQRLVRNGYYQNTISTLFGLITFNVPRVRDNKYTDEKIIFTSIILRKIKLSNICINILLPGLWIMGFSTRGVGIFFTKIIKIFTKGTSSSNISILSKDYLKKLIKDFNNQTFYGIRYLNIYADAAYFHVKGIAKDLCIIAILGATKEGNKEILGLFEVKSESKEEWVRVFNNLIKRGLKEPDAVIGDGGKGLWAAVDEVFVNAKKLQCWVHKVRDILSILPKKNKKYVKVLKVIQKIYNVETKEEAIINFSKFKGLYNNLYPKAVKSIEDNLENLLNFLDFPIQYHVYLRTSNPIESLFSVVRLRTNRFKGCCSQKSLKDVIAFYMALTNENLTSYVLTPPKSTPFHKDADPCELALASIENADVDAFEDGYFDAFEDGYFDAFEDGDFDAIKFGDFDPIEVGDLDAIKFDDFDPIEGGENVAMENGDNVAIGFGDNVAMENGDNVAMENGDNVAMENGDNVAIEFGDFDAIEGGDIVAMDGDNFVVKKDDNLMAKEDDNTVANKVGDIWEDKDVAEIWNTAKARDIPDGNGVAELCNTVTDCRIAKSSYSAEGIDVTKFFNITYCIDVADRDIAEVCNIAIRNNIAETDDIANGNDIMDSS